MAFARRYETFEVRGMLQGAEGVASPNTGKGAHSRGLHAQSTPGGVGVDSTSMMYRTHKQVGESNKGFSNRGGATQTSAFANLIQQADAACQALNSNKGFQGLAVLDATAHAAKKLRLTLEIMGIGEIGFLGTAPGKMKTVGKNDTTVTKTQTKGVQVIIDRGPNGTSLHIQTCYPLSACTVSKFSVEDLGAKATVANG